MFMIGGDKGWMVLVVVWPNEDAYSMTPKLQSSMQFMQVSFNLGQFD